MSVDASPRNRNHHQVCLCFLLHDRCKERNVEPQPLPGLAQRLDVDQAEARTFHILPDSRASSQEPKHLDRPIVKIEPSTNELQNIRSTSMVSILSLFFLRRTKETSLPTE